VPSPCRDNGTFLQFIPLANMDTYLRPAMPKAEFYVIDDADHMLYSNRPEVFIPMMLSFFEDKTATK
jgi:pimeloyl-ACP methyl ester carboxylesterase